MSTAPRFGGGGVKCTRCDKTVYQSERLDYDNQPYHHECFKCLECKNVVGLSAVAMIKGKLYCKTCFLRIFSKEGKYSSFGDETLPQAEGGKDTLNKPRPNRADSSSPGDATTSLARARSQTTVVNGSNGSNNTPAASSSPAPAAVSSSPAPAAAVVPAKELTEEEEASNDLFSAIAGKNESRVRDILSREKTTDIVFRRNNKKITPLEAAFQGLENSRACGDAILEWMEKKIKA